MNLALIAKTYSVERGWIVIPVKGKRPLVRDWTKITVQTQEQIGELWTQYPGANIGVVTGKVSGIVVLDVDARNEGYESLKKLEALYGPLPTTLTASTGGGGKHYYFRYPNIQVYNSASKIGRGLDIRGEGGQVVAPPSVHENGVIYKWDNEAEIAEIPQWLLDLILNREGTGTQKAEQVGDIIPEGERNSTLFYEAIKLWNAGTELECIREKLTYINEEKCCPRLPITEIENILKSVSNYERETKEKEELPFKRKNNWKRKIDNSVWHGIAGDIVKQIEPQTESDPIALLIQLLVCFGNTIGRSAYFLVESTKHYLNIYVVLVGKSSKGRKGTAWDITNNLFEGNDNLNIASGLSSGEGLIYKVRDPEYKLNKNGEEVKIDDGADDKRLLVVQTEFGETLKIIKREGNTLSPVIRDAWDGKTLGTLTKNSPTKATNPHVSIIGHITEGELQKSLSDSEISNGFGNRFLWLYVQRSRLLPHGGKLPNLLLMANSIHRAVAYAKTVGEIRFNEQAHAYWEEIYPALTGEKYGVSGSLTSRSEAQAIRLASIYALLDMTNEITVDHLKAALGILQYSQESCQYIFGEMIGDPIADEIYSLLSARPLGVSRNSIRDHFNRNVSSSRIEYTLGILYDQKKAFYVREKTTGRPIEKWFLSKGVNA